MTAPAITMYTTAVSPADIKAAGIDRPQDFVALTPNMSLVQTQNQGTSFVTVRGISQARNSEPSVAVLIDGVQMANPSQFNQELFDIDTIQVLKGPQGAIYGRNAAAGAIVIQTLKPTDSLSGAARISYGEHNSWAESAHIAGSAGGRAESGAGGEDGAGAGDHSRQGRGGAAA